MSSAFGDREKGFERKYQLDQEQQFRVQSRRDKLFGQWAASKLGLTGSDADTYAQEVVGSNFEKPGDNDMLSKVRGDFKTKNVNVSDADLIKRLREVEIDAVNQIVGDRT